MNTVVISKKLSEKEKDDLLKEILAAEYSSAGNNLPILKSAIDIIGHFDTAFGLAELIPLINTALSSSRIFGFVASGASIFSIFMFPVTFPCTKREPVAEALLLCLNTKISFVWNFCALPCRVNRKKIVFKS